MNESLSIVIICCDDKNIYKCIASIKRDAYPELDYEIIVSLVLNDEINSVLKKYKNIKIVITKRGNLSKSRNIGIKNAKYPLILLLDSDLVLEKGYLKKMMTAKNENAIVKSNIEFESTGILTSITAKSRKIGHLDKPYAPGIIISKKLFNKFGLFNEEIPYSEDGELIERFQNSGIPTIWVRNATIFHPPVSFRHDFKMAFKIGQGRKLATEKRTIENKENLKEIIEQILKGNQLKYFVSTWKKWGLSVAIYEVIWYTFYYLGFYNEKNFSPKSLDNISSSR